MSLTDPEEIAAQTEYVAAAESCVRQAANNKPIGAAETAEAALGAAIKEYQDARRDVIVLELKISQRPLAKGWTQRSKGYKKPRARSIWSR
jgi:hypothetical protein